MIRGGGALRVVARVALLAVGLTAEARDDRQRDVAGVFDYYVLSLSWSPEYCATTRRDGEPQCARPYAFVAHGLWPQHERGWPEDCGGERVPEATIARLLPIMPSRPLIIHEWRKHGSCSGLGAERYFRTVEQAWHRVRIPDRYRQLATPLTVPTRRLRADLLAANPDWRSDGLVLICNGRHLKEARLCLDRELEPRRCGASVRERCRGDVTLRPVR